MMEDDNTFFSRLPDDCWAVILSFLKPMDLFRASTACQWLRLVADSNELFQQAGWIDRAGFMITNGGSAEDFLKGVFEKPEAKSVPSGSFDKVPIFHLTASVVEDLDDDLMVHNNCGTFIMNIERVASVASSLSPLPSVLRSCEKRLLPFHAVSYWTAKLESECRWSQYWALRLALNFTEVMVLKKSLRDIDFSLSYKAEKAKEQESPVDTPATSKLHRKRALVEAQLERSLRQEQFLKARLFYDLYHQPLISVAVQQYARIQANFYAGMANVAVRIANDVFGESHVNSEEKDESNNDLPHSNKKLFSPSKFQEAFTEDEKHRYLIPRDVPQFFKTLSSQPNVGFGIEFEIDITGEDTVHDDKTTEHEATDDTTAINEVWSVEAAEKQREFMVASRLAQQQRSAPSFTARRINEPKGTSSSQGQETPPPRVERKGWAPAPMDFAGWKTFSRQKE